MDTVASVLKRMDLTNITHFRLDGITIAPRTLRDVYGNLPVTSISIVASNEVLNKQDILYSINADDSLELIDVELPPGATYIKLTLNLNTGGDHE